MDDMTPENLNPEELLSAYLDGEVTADQRAQVEQMLASDPEARAALEELRALGAALQSLPKLTVGEDLSERVLRRAERAMLERQSTEPAVAPADAQQTPPVSKTSSSPTTLVDKNPTTSEDGIHGAGWMRRLAWPMAAIAATVLIMLVSQKQKPELALAPVNSAPQAPPAPNSDAGVTHGDSESLEAAPDESGELFAENEFRSKAGWENKKGGRELDSFELNQEAFPQQEFLGDKPLEKSQVASSEPSPKEQSARTSAKNARDGNGRFATSSERQLQGTGQPKLANAGSPNGANAAPDDLARGDALGAGAAAPGAALSDSPAADAMPAKTQSHFTEPRVQMVVEVVSAYEATEVDEFNNLLARQNIRIDDFDSHRRKQLAQNSSSFGDEQTKSQKAGNLGRSGQLANDRNDNRPIDPSKPGAKPPLGSQEKKLAEAKENERKSEATDEIAKSAGQTKPSAPLAIRGNNGEPETKTPAPAPSAQSLANNDTDHFKQSDGEGGDKSGQGGGGSGLNKESGANTNDVEVVLVTATPAQVRELLNDINGRSTQYRAMQLGVTPNLQDLDDRPATAGKKYDSPVDSLAANRTNPDLAKNAPPAPAEAARAEERAVLEPARAVRWRVSEDQLASLLQPESLNQLSIGDRAFWSNSQAAEQPVDGVTSTEERNGSEALDQKRSREETAGDSASSTLRAEVAEGAAKATAAAAPQKTAQTEFKPTVTSAPADQSGDARKLKEIASGESLEKKSDHRQAAKDADEANSPASRPKFAKGNEAPFGEDSQRDQVSRAGLEKQLRGSPPNEQIRVLFVLRGRSAGSLQGQTGAAVESSTRAVQPNAADPAPAAESTPTEATPAKE